MTLSGHCQELQDTDRAQTSREGIAERWAKRQAMARTFHFQGVWK